MPALNYAERDRLEDQLEPDDEQAVIEATRELMSDGPLGPAPSEDGPPAIALASEPDTRLRVLGYAANGEGDSLALEMLTRLLAGMPIALEIAGPRLLAAELIALVKDKKYAVVCIADLPPSPSSKTRYLVRRLRAAFPDLPIVIGRWAPPALADETMQPLIDAGGTHVSATLLETRRQLFALAHLDTKPGPDRAHAA